jgi:ABC-type uncharacterized transport system substrate-binding protein
MQNSNRTALTKNKIATEKSMFKRLVNLSIAFMFILLSALNLSAHPHVFVDSTVKFVFDENGLAGAEVNWVFDEMFSSMIILDYDKNANQQFEPAEITKVRQQVFANLRQFNYFMHIKIDGKSFAVNFVTEFSAAIIEGKVVYRFFVPCHVKASATFKELQLSIYDNTFYSSVFLEKKSLKFKNWEAYEVRHSTSINRNNAYYYGQIYPEEINLRFKKKK